jgi:hypothetical protein
MRSAAITSAIAPPSRWTKPRIIGPLLSISAFFGVAAIRTRGR